VSDQIDVFTALPDPGLTTVGKFQRPGAAAVTQRSAAIEAYPATGTQRRRVLQTIASLGERGATDEELQHILDMNPSTERPRRVELVESGWIENSEDKRPTKAGRSAVVWCLTPAGREQFGRLP
jgi:predicted ArsR family transcriptional regulator